MLMKGLNSWMFSANSGSDDKKELSDPSSKALLFSHFLHPGSISSASSAQLQEYFGILIGFCEL